MAQIKKKKQEKKKKAREQKNKEQVALRRQKKQIADKQKRIEDKKQRDDEKRWRKMAEATLVDRGVQVDSPIKNEETKRKEHEEICEKLKHNLEILTQMEADYKKDAEQRQNLNARLEGEGCLTMDDKMKKLYEEALQTAQEQCQQVEERLKDE